MDERFSIRAVRSLSTIRCQLAAAAVAALLMATLAGPRQQHTPDGSDLPRVAKRISEGKSLRIVAFGSSSTEGVGASNPSASYPARLEAVLRTALPGMSGGVTVVNRGIGGDDVDDMVERLDRDVLAGRPDLVIWQTGSNDPMRHVSLDHFKAATSRAILRIREAGIDVMLMEPQWCPRLQATPGADAFRDAVRETGRELDVPVIRRFDLMVDWIGRSRLTRKEMLSPDGLHMADGGYALLAKSTAAEILEESDAMKGVNGEAATVAVED